MIRTSRQFFPDQLVDHGEHQSTESRILMHQLNISFNFD